MGSMVRAEEEHWQRAYDAVATLAGGLLVTTATQSGVEAPSGPGIWRRSVDGSVISDSQHRTGDVTTPPSQPALSTSPTTRWESRSGCRPAESSDCGVNHGASDLGMDLGAEDQDRSTWLLPGQETMQEGSASMQEGSPSGDSGIDQPCAVIMAADDDSTNSSTDSVEPSIRHELRRRQQLQHQQQQLQRQQQQLHCDEQLQQFQQQQRLHCDQQQSQQQHQQTQHQLQHNYQDHQQQQVLPNQQLLQNQQPNERLLQQWQQMESDDSTVDEAIDASSEAAGTGSVGSPAAAAAEPPSATPTSASGTSASVDSAYLDSLHQMGANYLQRLADILDTGGHSEASSNQGGASTQGGSTSQGDPQAHSSSSTQTSQTGHQLLSSVQSDLLAHFRDIISRNNDDDDSSGPLPDLGRLLAQNVGSTESAQSTEFTARLVSIYRGNVEGLFSGLLAHFYYETFLWMYLIILYHPHYRLTRNRLKFLGSMTSQSQDLVLLNLMVGFFNGFQQGREALTDSIIDCLRHVSVSHGSGQNMDPFLALRLRELSIELGIHLNPRQMLKSFTMVVRDVVSTRVIASRRRHYPRYDTLESFTLSLYCRSHIDTL